MVDEAIPLRQTADAYGEGEALAEQVAWKAAAKGLKVTVLRPPTIGDHVDTEGARAPCDRSADEFNSFSTL